MIGCLPYAPWTGIEPWTHNLECVLGSGIEPATFWYMDDAPTNWGRMNNILVANPPHWNLCLRPKAISYQKSSFISSFACLFIHLQKQTFTVAYSNPGLVFGAEDTKKHQMQRLWSVELRDMDLQWKWWPALNFRTLSSLLFRHSAVADWLTHWLILPFTVALVCTNHHARQ